MKITLSTLFYVAVTLAPACSSESQFDGGVKKSQAETGDEDALPEKPTRKNIKSNRTASEKNKALKKDPGTIEAEIKVDYTNCWVAVSGVLFGAARYSETVHITKFADNGLPLPNPEYDAVLPVTEPTLTYLRTDSEIKAPIQTTLDSMLITPGVKVEIFDKTTQNLLGSFEGPKLITSSLSGITDIAETSALYAHHGNTLPTWLRTILDEGDKIVMEAGGCLFDGCPHPDKPGLHNVGRIKLSKIPETACD